MQSNPLSYESLKSVFFYLEPNYRIQLAQRIPSIRTAEKEVPLRINELFLESFRTKVNDTEYQIGLIRNFENYEGYENFQTDVENGGVQHDLDEFGVIDRSCERMVLPGDVKTQYSPRFSTIEYQRLELLEYILKLYNTVPEFQGVGNDEDPVDVRKFITVKREAFDPLNRLRARAIFDLIRRFSDLEIAGNMYKADDGVVMMVASEKMNQKQFLKVNRKLRVLVEMLKQDKKPYTCQILSTTTSPKAKVVERVMNNRKIHEAMKCLNNGILGGRRQAIHVRHLHLRPGSEVDDGIIRLPEGMKLKVDHLSIGYSMKKAIVGFESIILDSTPLLKSVFITGFESQYAINKPIVLKSEKLVMDYGVDSIRWPRIESKIPNKRLHVRRSYIETSSYRNLAENWIQNRKEVGTWYSFGMPLGEENNGQKIFEALCGASSQNINIIQHPSFPTFPYHIKFSIGRTLELLVYGEDPTEPDERVQQSWVLNFKVQQAESA